jgi:hypothetical protein
MLQAEGELQAVVAALKIRQEAFLAAHGRYEYGELAPGYWVECYEGPLGDGWTVTRRVTENGVTYRRTVHVAGPEGWREAGWVREEG